MLEPASLGVPLVSGEHTANFAEIIGLFKDADAIMTVTGAAQLAAAVTSLLQDEELRWNRGERARRLVQRNQGALDSVMELLDNYLESNS